MSRPAKIAKLGLRPLRLKIRGQYWRVVFEAPPKDKGGDFGDHGLCHYETRTLYVDPLKADVWGTYLHEVLHAALPDICEEAIADTEAAIVAALSAYPTELVSTRR